MTSITTVAELDALPVGAVLLDVDGDAWQKTGALTFHCAASGPDWSGGCTSVELTGLGLLRLMVLEPRHLDALHMTRCVADGCQSTHPLPPGSSWACPEHTSLLPGGGSES